MDYLFPPPAPAALPIRGSSALFPVRRVYCVGRNYAAHAREMGADPQREPPFFFCKHGDAQSVVPVPAGSRATLPYPPFTADFQHEVELVAAIGKGGSRIPAEEALSHVFGYAVGLDMTRRDLQTEMRRAGRPWETGKAFDYATPVGTLCPAADAPHIGRAALMLTVNGRARQSGNTADMIWSVAETLARLSEFFTLHPGDLVFTGTPEGVSAVSSGDVLHASVEGLDDIEAVWI